MMTTTMTMMMLHQQKQKKQANTDYLLHKQWAAFNKTMRGGTNAMRSRDTCQGRARGGVVCEAEGRRLWVMGASSDGGIDDGSKNEVLMNVKTCFESAANISKYAAVPYRANLQFCLRRRGIRRVFLKHQFDLCMRRALQQQHNGACRPARRITQTKTPNTYQR